MWCLKVRKQLSAYTDGELGRAEARAIEAHLVACPRCAGEERELRRLARLTALVPEEEIPAGLHARIMMGLTHARSAPAARYPARRGVLLGPWAGVALSGVAAAAFLGVLNWRAPAPALPQAPVANVRTVPNAPAAPPTAGPVAAVPHPAAAVAPAAPQHEQMGPERPLMGAILVEAARPPAPAERPRVARRPAAPSRPSALETEPKDSGSPGKPGSDKPGTDPAPIMALGPGAPAMTPNEAVMTGTGPEPVMVGMEGGTRMAGMTPEPDPLPDEDEALRPARMFLEERLRTIPQPPLIDPSRDRRMRKSL